MSTVGEHQKMCEERLAVLLTSSESLSDEEAARLGKKDPDHEVYYISISVSVSLSKTPHPYLLTASWLSPCMVDPTVGVCQAIL